MVAVFTVLGRTFMKPVDCPFRASDRILDRIGGDARVVIVDIHAEATSDKQLLGRYLDGRVSAALGTHTHVATADEQVLKHGTAYQTDVGMTGPHDSILGRRYDRVLSATLTCVPAHFDVATGDPRLNGALLTIDPLTGRALRSAGSASIKTILSACSPIRSRSDKPRERWRGTIAYGARVRKEVWNRSARERAVPRVQAAFESSRHGSGVVEGAVLDIMPANPSLADQEGRRRLEDTDQAGFGRIERPNPLVRRERFPASGWIAVQPFADQAREVSRHRFDSHRPEVDQAAQALSVEQEMLGPCIAKDGLDTNQPARHQAERLEQQRGHVSSLRKPRECKRFGKGPQSRF